MSTIYDNWEKLVGAVMRREKDRQLAYCESFDSSSSADLSSRFSFRLTLVEYAMHQSAAAAGEVSIISYQNIDHSDLSSSNIFFSRNVRAIEYEEIRKATRYSRGDNMLGEGSSSIVYKDWIDEQSLTAVKPGVGIPVSVKNMNESEDLKCNKKKWMEEISHLRHPNLVTPIGYCFNTDQTIFVYEFMHRGSLENHLFKRRPFALPWSIRIKVTVGVARGLAFLHSLKIPVIYGKLKINNILLDSDYNPKLSDLGLPEHSSDPETHYKYGIEGQLSTKSDVYSFGFVLLQLLSGLQVFDRIKAVEKCNLIDWATPYMGSRKGLWEIMDSRLEGQFPHKQAWKVAQLALRCVCSDPRSRPTMAEVVAALKRL